MTRHLPQNKWYGRLLQIFTFVVVFARLLSLDTITWDYLNQPKDATKLAKAVKSGNSKLQPKSTNPSPMIDSTSARTVIQKIKKLGGVAEEPDSSSTTIATVRGAETSLKPTQPPEPTITNLPLPISPQPTVVDPTAIPTTQTSVVPTIEISPTIEIPSPTNEPTPATAGDASIASSDEPLLLLLSPTVTADPTVTPTPLEPIATDSASLKE